MWKSVSSLVGHSKHPRAFVALIHFRTLTRWHTYFGKQIGCRNEIAWKMKGSGFAPIQSYLFVAESGTSVMHDFEQLEEQILGNWSGFKLFSRNAYPVRRGGYSQCIWRACAGMNHFAGYSILPVRRHERYSGCRGWIILSLARGITQMLVSSPSDQIQAFACMCSTSLLSYFTSRHEHLHVDELLKFRGNENFWIWSLKALFVRCRTWHIC
jgi:hypothetical protein